MLFKEHLKSGWSPVLYRVMEGITAYLLPGGIVVFVILFLSCLHFNHLFIWMDPDVVAQDKIISRIRSGYLNIPFFLARALFFISGWALYRYFSRKFSLLKIKANDIVKSQKKF